MKRLRGERGFTLVELLVVCGILVILAAVATPTVGSYISSAHRPKYHTL